MNFRIVSIILAFFLSALVAIAQQAHEQYERHQSSKNTVQKPSIPELYEGESEDLGPQVLLDSGAPAAQPKHQYFQLWTHGSVNHLTNPTQNESRDSGANLMVLGAGFAINHKPVERDTGTLYFQLGATYDIFRYGEFNNKENDVINGNIIDIYDFDASGLYAHMTFKPNDNNLKYDLGLRYAYLSRADGNHSLIYEETVPYFGVDYTWNLKYDATLNIAYAASYHFSTTKTQANVPNPPLHQDAYNRFTHGITGVYTYPFREKYYVQPVLRFQHIKYPHNRKSTFNYQDDRTDMVSVAGLTVGWKINEDTDLKLYTTYERRDSTEDPVQDYSNWTTGLASSINFRW